MRLKPILLILFFLILCSVSHAAVNDAIRYYSFDIGDIVGSTIIDLTLTSNATNVSTDNPTGILGLCMDFEAAENDYVYGNNRIAPQNVGALSFWIKPESSTAQVPVFHQSVADGASSCQLQFTAASELQIYCVGSGTVSDAITDGQWTHVAVTWDGTNYYWYYNGSLTETDAQSMDMWQNTTSASPFSIGQDYYGGAPRGSKFDGLVDEVAFYDHNLTQTDVDLLFNSGLGFNPYANLPTDIYFSLTDDFNGSSILSFSINVTWGNGSLNTYGTTNGTVTLLDVGDEDQIINITYWNMTAYYNKNLFNEVITANTSNIITTTTGKIYRVFNITYYNYTLYNSINYTRNLTYSINLTCPDFDNTSVVLNVSGVIVSTNNLTCNNASQIITGSYQASTEGSKPVSFYYNATGYKETFGSQSFTYDLYNPTASINFTILEGFNNHITNVTLICTDNILNISTYNNTLNGNVLRYANLTNNTQLSNSSTLIDGVNTAFGTCSDLFGTDNDTYSLTVYAKTLALIDERNNSALNVANLSSVRAYYDDNSTYYDFKIAGNVSTVNFTSILTNKLRFELVYATGDVIIRYVDTTLLTDPIRVCGNLEGVTHYEQLLISAIEKPVVVKNVFSNCVIAADYTRFAYQSSLVLKAYSINSLYYLYTFDEGNQVLLASLDGSISTYINLDTLEFNQNAYDVSVLGDALAFEKVSSTQMLIYYKNLEDNNANLSLVITQIDNNTHSVVFTTSSFTNPNNFSMYFDFTTLNITNETLFKITLTKTSDEGITSTLTKYFNTQAKSGLLASGVGFTIAFLLVIFGLTFTIARTTFSWFGIAIVIASIGVLTFTMAAWFVTFLMVIDVIILVFICIVLSYQTYPTVS